MRLCPSPRKLHPVFWMKHAEKDRSTTLQKHCVLKYLMMMFLGNVKYIGFFLALCNSAFCNGQFFLF